MKVIIFTKFVYEYFESKYKEVLESKGHELIYMNPKKMLDTQDECIIISGQMTEENLVHFPKLKLVIVPYTGMDGLPVDFLKSKGIKVLNTSAHSFFVAERALLLTLGFLGRLTTFHNGMTQGDWSKRTEIGRLRWTSLKEKKVAIYGYGSIGKHLHRFVQPFNCQVGILNYKNRDYEGTQLFPNLKELAKWCDIFVICAPLNDMTKHSINSEVISQMKDKLLINIGRGDIVEEEALYNALVNDELLGYGSDVWFLYPTRENKHINPSNYPIHELPNVLMTPHNAGFENRSEEVRYDDVYEQINAFLGDK